MIILVFRYFWQKKIFSNPPCMGCLTGGRGESAFWGGGLLTLDQNETFHSLFLCYPATFSEKIGIFIAKYCSGTFSELKSKIKFLFESKQR